MQSCKIELNTAGFYFIAVKFTGGLHTKTLTITCKQYFTYPQMQIGIILSRNKVHIRCADCGSPTPKHETIYSKSRIVPIRSGDLHKWTPKFQTILGTNSNRVGTKQGSTLWRRLSLADFKLKTGISATNISALEIPAWSLSRFKCSTSFCGASFSVRFYQVIKLITYVYLINRVVIIITFQCKAFLNDHASK